MPAAAHSTPVVASEDARPAKKARTDRTKTTDRKKTKMILFEFFRMGKALYSYNNWETVLEKAAEGSDEPEEVRADKGKRRMNRDGFLQYILKAEPTGVDDIYRVKVEYSKSAHGFGRWWAQGPAQQNMHRCVRHTIAGDLYHDIDMMCSIYSHFAEYCKKKELPYAQVFAHFVANKDDLIQQFMTATGITSKAKAKKEINKIPNGGKPHEQAPEYFSTVNKATAELYKHIIVARQDLWKIAQDMAKKKREEGAYSNPRASWEALRDCTVDKKWSAAKDGVAAHDRAQLRIGPKTPAEESVITKSCELAILEKTGFNISLKIKPMDEVIPVPEYSVGDAEMELADLRADAERPNEDDDSMEIEDYDKEGAEILLKKLGDHFIYSEKLFYAKLETGLWTFDQDQVHMFLKRATIGLGLMTRTAKGKLVPYSSKSHNAESIINVAKAMRAADETPFFHDHVMNASRGKMFFRDGYYIAKEKRFVKGFEGVDSFVCVPRKFPERNPKKIKDVMETFVNPILGNPTTEVHKAFMHIGSRALFGVREKLSMTVIGERDCGKTKFIMALLIAFGVYVGVFNSGVLLNSHDTGDANRNAVVFLELELARWAFSSEVKMGEIINGILLKMWQSGRESFRARDVGEKSRPVQPRSLPSILGNDIPNVDRGDALEANVPLRFPNKFVEKSVMDERPYDETLKLKDDSIEDYIYETEVSEALIHIMIDAYVDKPFAWSDYKTLKEWRDNELGDTNQNSLDKVFDFTGNPNDQCRATPSWP